LLFGNAPGFVRCREQYPVVLKIIGAQHALARGLYFRLQGAVLRSELCFGVQN
jgi:hypothetical protein